jgi:hypothetical protein
MPSGALYGAVAEVIPSAKIGGGVGFGTVHSCLREKRGPVAVRRLSTDSHLEPLTEKTKRAGDASSRSRRCRTPDPAVPTLLTAPILGN